MLERRFCVLVDGRVVRVGLVAAGRRVGCGGGEEGRGVGIAMFMADFTDWIP
jgi:hypothetical protein